jgi:hypothetical protein
MRPIVARVVRHPFKPAGKFGDGALIPDAADNFDLGSLREPAFWQGDRNRKDRGGGDQREQYPIHGLSPVA